MPLPIVDQCEIKLIKETFKDLCHLNGGSMRIDKELFLQYLPLPGLLGGKRDLGDIRGINCVFLEKRRRLGGGGSSNTWQIMDCSEARDKTDNADVHV